MTDFGVTNFGERAKRAARRAEKARMEPREYGECAEKQCQVCPFRTRALCVLSGVGCRVRFERRCPVCGSRLVNP